MNDNTPAPGEMQPLWDNGRINEYINTALSDQPNHTPRGLVRRVSYEVRDSYEAERTALAARVAELERELDEAKQRAFLGGAW